MPDTWDVYIENKFVKRIHYFGYMQVVEKDLKDKSSNYIIKYNI